MDQERAFSLSETERMLGSYNTGVTGWRVVDGAATIIVLLCTLSAAAVAKFKYFDSPSDISAALALAAAVATGLQKYYRPIERYRRDWTARSDTQQLFNSLRSDPAFDPKSATDRLNKIMAAHDKNWV